MSRQQKRKVERDDKKAASRKKASARRTSPNRQTPSPQGMKKAERRAYAVDLLTRHGIEVTEPVRFEFAPVADDDEALDRFIKRKTANTWVSPLHFPRPNAPKPARKRGQCLIQYRNGRWSCSCPQWLRQRDVDCQHIKRVKRKEKIGLEPFETARRRPGTVWAFPPGTATEETRRAKAYAAMPTRIPQLMEILCEMIGDREYKGSGAKGMPLRVAAYGQLARVARPGMTYQQLIADLSGDEAMLRLGWTKPCPPSRGAWITRLGEIDLTFALLDLHRLTVRPVRYVDLVLLVDSDDNATVMVDNSRDRKFGPKRPSYRPDAEMLRHHFGVGDISNVIYVADFSLDSGLGSNDNIHLARFMRKAMEISETIWASVADKQYPSYRNFVEAHKLGLKLFIREKANEERLRGAWPEHAKEMKIMESERPEEFKETYRKRQKGEGTPSRRKRLWPHCRARRRKRDPKVEYPIKPAADEKKLRVQISRLPDATIERIIECAALEIGIARLNESLAVQIVMNLASLVMLEHLLDDDVDFATDKAFSPVRIHRESELVE